MLRVYSVLQAFLFAVIFSVIIYLNPVAAQEGKTNLSAFSDFVKQENYSQANFYLQNGFINPSEINTSQLFFDVFMEKLSKDLIGNAERINTLYNYLNELAPLDFNRTVRCGYRKESICLLANNLMTGAKPEVMAYFLDRGLDLNFRAAGVVPTTVPLLLRMGSIYNLEDLNFFTSRGLILGSDTYAISELAAYSDDYLRNQVGSSSSLNLPASYLSLNRLNMLDVLVISLGTNVGEQDTVQSMRRRMLCEFISYAAPSFAPSFDYLSYVLNSVEQFRGSAIGKLETYRSRGEVFEPFPQACVTLMRNMAMSHANLESIISRFAANADVETANWLISIRSGQQ